MQSVRKFLSSIALIAVASIVSTPAIKAAVIDDAADLWTQQAQEKQEIDEMRSEMGDVKSTIRDATHELNKAQQKLQQRASMKEVHLLAKEGSWEVAPGASTTALTYNGQMPGPAIRVTEGDAVKVVLHNNMQVPTSILFHGMVLPHTVNGLPRKDAGLVAPGQTFAFQFIAPAAGTYWYHPQVVHGDQTSRGLYGAMVVEPRSPKTYDQDVVLVLGQVAVARPGKGTVAYFTVNGKSAPAIAPLEVRNGERVRLRMVNASQSACPIYLTGHKFKVVGVNGSDTLEPQVTRDTMTLQPGDRYDVEFVANNPGVWSLASLQPSQTNNDGKFPGGIAVVVRYPDALGN